jgi:uncharacterized protein YhfF
MWREFQEATGTRGDPAGAFAFGDTAELADELAGLVRHGAKRATASLLLEYEHDGEDLPDPGTYWVVVDGRGQPVCIIRTAEVRTRPFDEVDEAFAWDEGEGDRSLTSWRDGHRRYFGRVCARLGVAFTGNLPTVLERFDLVWPAEVRPADPAGGPAGTS